ncbi:Ser/Thr phosphatase family protein [Ancylostoma caninum]|uniref:Serine/threonine-protein phosphatase n=1 Tax=Ancylostoma caninum TaxID=29170 RepID=A0A368GT14_ANCCA|nr:Ser/Thr phosphatase family protein [Ancylostoma caninum]
MRVNCRTHPFQASLERQPSLLEICAPVIIVGDIHGQYADLLNIFEECGWPFEKRYLFLGDYVDRGKNSLEVLVLVLALQIRFPRQVFLLRGNHEIKSVNKGYGFYGDLRLRYSEENECDQLLEAVGRVYGQLPLAALLCGKILCLHGGLSPKLQSVDDIRKIKRGTVEPSGLLEDLLWSDPSPTCTGFKANVDRGCSFVFGSDVVADRCQKMGILMIVRGHQAVDEGFEISPDRKVITLFSAPGYQDHYVNKGAVMIVSADRTVTFKQFTRQKCMKRDVRWLSIPMSE